MEMRPEAPVMLSLRGVRVMGRGGLGLEEDWEDEARGSVDAAHMWGGEWYVWACGSSLDGEGGRKRGRGR